RRHPRPRKIATKPATIIIPHREPAARTAAGAWRSVGSRSAATATGGALGMVERMEVKVLCGACRRQPQAEGNCTRRLRTNEPESSFPRGRVGWKPEVYR